MAQTGEHLLPSPPTFRRQGQRALASHAHAAAHAAPPTPARRLPACWHLLTLSFSRSISDPTPVFSLQKLIHAGLAFNAIEALPPAETLAGSPVLSLVRAQQS